MSKAKIGLIGIIGEEAKTDYWGTMAGEPSKGEINDGQFS
jgi:hypothetical protein